MAICRMALTARFLNDSFIEIDEHSIWEHYNKRYDAFPKKD